MFDLFVIIVENISIILLRSEFLQRTSMLKLLLFYNPWEILLKLLIYFIEIVGDGC
jgi:hypothetical protein